MKVTFKKRSDHCPDCGAVLNLPSITSYINGWIPQSMSTECVNCGRVVDLKVTPTKIKVTPYHGIY